MLFEVASYESWHFAVKNKYQHLIAAFQAFFPLHIPPLFSLIPLQYYHSCLTPIISGCLHSLPLSSTTFIVLPRLLANSSYSNTISCLMTFSFIYTYIIFSHLKSHGNFLSNNGIDYTLALHYE